MLTLSLIEHLMIGFMIKLDYVLTKRFTALLATKKLMLFV